MGKQAHLKTADTAREKAAAMREQQQRSQRNQRIIVGGGVTVVIGLIMAIVVAAVMAGGGSAASTAKLATPANLATGGAMVPGQADAPTTVEIYFDPMCPACGAFEKANQASMAQRLAAGDFKLHLYPMAFLDRQSQGSQYSTRAVNALATVHTERPDLTWDLFNALYTNQPAEGTEGLTDQQLAELAQGVGVPATVTGKFAASTYKAWVAKATEDASSRRAEHADGQGQRHRGFREPVRPQRPQRCHRGSDVTATELSRRASRIRHSDAFLYGTMLFSSVLSLIASFVLSVDAIALAKDPAAVLSCSINAVISCGTVGASWQASLLGFPNAFLGLIAEAVVVTICVAALGGVRFPRWFMFAAQIVYTLGLIFAYWLFYQTMFEIGALCPWCLLVTLSTTLVFATMTHINIRDDNLYLPEHLSRSAQAAIKLNLDLLIVLAVVLSVILAVVLKYGTALFA